MRDVWSRHDEVKHTPNNERYDVGSGKRMLSFFNFGIEIQRRGFEVGLGSLSKQ